MPDTSKPQNPPNPPHPAAAPAPATPDADAKAKADAAAKPEPAAAAKPATADPNTVDTLSAIAEVMKGMQQRAAPAAAHATVGLDETQPGGVYLVKGKKVNAHGRELNDDGSIKYPEQLRVNEFGQLV